MERAHHENSGLVRVIPPAPVFALHQLPEQLGAAAERYCDLGVLGESYKAHSFRASFTTTTNLAGQSNDFIRNQTGHKTDSILARYTRMEDKKTYNAGKALGL